MKVLKIELPGKPVLLVPVYDLASILMWLCEYLDPDNVECRLTTVEL